MLSTSTLTAVATADQNLFYDDVTFPNQDQAKNIPHYEFTVSDSTGVTSSHSNQEENPYIETQSKTIPHYNFVVGDKMGIVTDDFSEKVAIVKQISDRKAIMELD